MRKLSSDEIRDIWLNFFKDHGHYIEPSASLIPNNDPTLLWINAGVAALKKYFDGTLTPKHRRITNAQKCIRTNDIDNVGHTARHHTFFERMGNFSIGDYFRPEVIPWAYELLTVTNTMVLIRTSFMSPIIRMTKIPTTFGSNAVFRKKTGCLASRTSGKSVKDRVDQIPKSTTIVVSNGIRNIWD